MIALSSQTKPANILIVSASVGDGHTQAALAIKAAIEQQQSASARVVDFMAGENSYLNTLVKTAYLKLIDIFPDMYDMLYHFSQMPLPGNKAQSLMAIFMKRSMLTLINTYQPDAVICTHPFPCGAAAYLKRNHKIDLPLIGVITDFAIHRFWRYDETDLYFVAAPELKQQLAAQDISLSRIHATGIPVSPKFSYRPEPAELAELRQTLGFSDNQPVLLIMGGGLGLGDLEQAVLDLDTLALPFNLVVVTGRNATLRRRLLAKTHTFVHPLKVIGYTKQVPELMSVADLLITKPGALTISEALSMRLPQLLYQAIPGHEEENAVYLTNKGAALWARSRQSLAATTQELLSSPSQLAQMRKMAGLIAHPAAAQTIAATIWQELFSGNPDFLR